MKPYDVVRSRSLGRIGQIAAIVDGEATLRCHAFEPQTVPLDDLELWHGDPRDWDTRHGAPLQDVIRMLVREINAAKGTDLDDLWDEYEALTGITARGEERGRRSDGTASQAPSPRAFAAPRKLIYEEQPRSARE